MSRTQIETSQTEQTDNTRYLFTNLSPTDIQERPSSLKSSAVGTTPSGLIIGVDRRHFVKTVLETGESGLSTALTHLFQTVVSQAVASGGAPGVAGLHQKDLYYGRKSAAVAIASPDNSKGENTMKISETDDGEVISGSARIPGSLETPSLVLVILTRPYGTSEPARLLLLESETSGVSFRLATGQSYGKSANRMVIADSVSLSPSMILGRESGDADFSDRVLFGWGAFGSAAMLTLLAAQAIRLISWSYRDNPGDWISSHESGYTFGDVILDQEASLAYLTRNAESADAFEESAHMYGYKALRYAYRTTSRIVEGAIALLEIAHPHRARYLEDKRKEFSASIGWQADVVPSFIRSCLPLPADRLLDPREHAPAA